MKIFGLTALCAFQVNAFSTLQNAATTQLVSSSSELFSSMIESGYRSGYGGGSYGGISIHEAWDWENSVKVQGGALRTWTVGDDQWENPHAERVQVLLMSEGLPINADIELCQGPNNKPQKMKVYSEDGNMRPFSCVMECQRGPNSVFVRNTGALEYPMFAALETDSRYGGSYGLMHAPRRLFEMSIPEVIQGGGALKTYSFDRYIESVQILLRTDGRPLNARVELLQGPDNDKQTIEIYTEDGMERPFFAVIECPGASNVVRVVNTASAEFPLISSVEPYLERQGGHWGRRDDYGYGGGSFRGGPYL